MKKEILENKLFEIDNAISSNFTNIKDIGVLTGITGISLFKFYFAKYLDDYNKIDEATELLTHGISKINQGYEVPTYCTGIAGAGWVIDHLKQEGFIDIDADAMLSELDNYIHDNLMTCMNNKYYDFLHGGLGYAYYFFNRFKNTESSELKSKYTAILLSFLTILEKIAEKEDENSYKWRSVVDSRTGREGYNFSLSHGISSIISFLAKLYQYEEFKSRVSTLLNRSLHYIFKFYSQDESKISYFRSYAYLDNETDTTPTRLAWCYGDLGVGLALLNTGKIINDKKAIDIATKTLKHASTIRTAEKSFVVDAGFCHGSFGIAHVFQKVYQSTNEKIFGETAKYWINDGIKRGKYQDGFAGFKQYIGLDRRFAGTLSILEGVAGIGLVIINQLSDFESKWDECLLISL